MRSMFIALALLALSILVACGGNGESGSGSFGSGFGGGRMTVEDYAAACANLEEQFDLDAFDDLSEPGDASDALDSMEGLLDEIKSWNPPSELEELHQIRVEGTGFIVESLKESGILELAVEIQKAEQEEDLERMLELAGEMAPMVSRMEEMEAEIEVFDARLERAEDELSSETYDLLSEADCI